MQREPAAVGADRSCSTRRAARRRAASRSRAGPPAARRSRPRRRGSRPQAARRARRLRRASGDQANAHSRTDDRDGRVHALVLRAPAVPLARRSAARCRSSRRATACTSNFPEAATLANEADVRISGVPVGKVKSKKVDPAGASTDVELEIDHQYAPIPKDTQRDPAPEDAARRDLRRAGAGRQVVGHDPGRRPHRRARSVAPTVELDEIFRAFDPKTRAGVPALDDRPGPRVRRTAART